MIPADNGGYPGLTRVLPCDKSLTSPLLLLTSTCNALTYPYQPLPTLNSSPRYSPGTPKLGRGYYSHLHGIPLISSLLPSFSSPQVVGTSLHVLLRPLAHTEPIRNIRKVPLRVRHREMGAAADGGKRWC